MEENNRKGPGVFYAVVGVATLVVAIIGATFAYFSASATNEKDITGTTAKGEVLTLNVTRVTTEATASNMVPMLTTDLSKGLTGEKQGSDSTPTSCVDLLGNTVCQVYSVTITNTGSTAVNVQGILNVDGAAATNIKWQLIADATTVGSVGSPIANKTDGFITQSQNLTAATVNGQPVTTNTVTYYVVIWLDETKGIQDSEAEQTYTGKVTFNALDASGNPTTGLTATFSA